jgi:hypothetical protein
VRPNFMSACDQQLADAVQPASPFPTISIQLSKGRRPPPGKRLRRHAPGRCNVELRRHDAWVVTLLLVASSGSDLTLDASPPDGGDDFVRMLELGLSGRSSAGADESPAMAEGPPQGS